MKYSNQKYVCAFTDLGFIVCFCLSLLPVQSDFDFSAPGFQYFDINIIHELAIITKSIANSRSKNSRQYFPWHAQFFNSFHISND